MMLPVLASRSTAPADGTPPRPPVMTIPLLAETEATLNAVDAVSAFCFAPIADSKSTPPTVKVPFKTVLPSQCSSRVAVMSRALMSPVHATLLTASWVLASMVVPPPALAVASAMFTPARYRGLPISALFFFC